MKVIRGMINIKPWHQGCVATIGNFDGLHLGHRELLARLQKKSNELQRPSMAIVFEPQPNEFFSSNNAIPRLMCFREKIEGFQQQGVDMVLCLRFDQTMASLDPKEFVRNVLVEKLSVAGVVVGEDFHFGYKRGGDVSLLQQLAETNRFKIECVPIYRLLGKRVSSSIIRKSLGTGDLQMAQRLLGRVYGMKGRVAHGDKRGRILGFPTANIHLQRKLAPISGVFAVKVGGIKEAFLPGVANLGLRPTISGQTKTILEVHLFDFNEDLYGKFVEVQFFSKIRDEKKFASLDDLKLQIAKDIRRAKLYFGCN